jgi:hypothetical protein
MRGPRIFFDTNVLEPLSKPPLGASLEKIRRLLLQKYSYVVSPLTVDELLLGVRGGEERYFAKDQAKMNILRGTGNLHVLAPPGTYALKHGLELHVLPPTDPPAVVKKLIGVFLKAKSRQQLEQGFVHLPLHRSPLGVNFEPIEQRHGWGKAEHARLLEELRAKAIRRPSPEEWVAKSFRHFHLSLPPADWTKLASALEAAYALNEFLCDQAEHDEYDFAEHDSDWIDVHQLFYLADPTVHFLTADKRLRNRISRCVQAGRIVVFQDMLTDLGIPT